MKDEKILIFLGFTEKSEFQGGRGIHKKTIQRQGRIDKSLRRHILASSFICDSYTHKAAVLQNIFKFCTFLPKFSNILPFFTLFCPFSEKIACMLLLVNFVNGFRLELMYISLTENIRSSLIQNNANSPASCRCHPHFCHLHPLVKTVTFSPTFLSYQTYQ